MFSGADTKLQKSESAVKFPLIPLSVVRALQIGNVVLIFDDVLGTDSVDLHCSPLLGNFAVGRAESLAL